MTIIDANYILRWFLGDVPVQASVVERLLTSSEPESIIIDRVTIAEVTYVLRAKGYDHKQIYTIFEELLYHASVVPLSNAEAAALRLYADSLLDFEDCLLIARAKTQHYQLGTFDKQMLNHMKE